MNLHERVSQIKDKPDLMIESTHFTSFGEVGPSIHSKWNAQSIVIETADTVSSTRNRPGQTLSWRTLGIVQYE
jgi:hypothetical protein